MSSSPCSDSFWMTVPGPGDPALVMIRWPGPRRPQEWLTCAHAAGHGRDRAEVHRRVPVRRKPVWMASKVSNPMLRLFAISVSAGCPR
jgi:hypothetical protein